MWNALIPFMLRIPRFVSSSAKLFGAKTTEIQQRFRNTFRHEANDDAENAIKEIVFKQD